MTTERGHTSAPLETGLPRRGGRGPVGGAPLGSGAFVPLRRCSTQLDTVTAQEG